MGKGNKIMIKRFINLIIIFIVSVLTILPVMCVADYGPSWDKNKINVFIPKEEKYSAMMERAFLKWQNMSFGQLEFIFVDEEKSADIEVEFVAETDGSDGDIGSYSLTVKGGALTGAKITIVADGTKYSNNMIYTVMLHEIGHALGLQDSKRKLGIMHSPVDETQDIISNDIIKLFRLNGWSYMNKGTFSSF